jgi:hypothetical protein
VAQPTAVPTNTPVDFGQPKVRLRYTIPALGLERTLEGSIGNQLVLVDLAQGTSLTLANQARPLNELQGFLPTLTLEPVPAGCGRCVTLAYELPLTGESGEGWLQDVPFLASVEQFFALQLGPHFPPGTVLGLHRTASPYTVAHTLAITADGEQWQWEAIEPEIAPPTTADGRYQTLLQELPLSRLEPTYPAPCPDTPQETLFVTGTLIQFNCPALTLPTPLVPLYQWVGELATAALDPDNNFSLPSQLLPLEAVLYYRDEAGAQLVAYPDGRLVRQAAEGDPATEVQIAASEVVSLTTSLITSGIIPRAVALAPELPAEVEAILLVRGELGVYEFGWSDNIGRALLPAVLELDRLLIE